MSPKCPRVTHETDPFSADLLPLGLWPMCFSTEISFQKGDFCVLVKFVSGFETPGINSAVGLVLVPEEKSSFSIVYSPFLYRNKFQIVQSDVNLFFSSSKGLSHYNETHQKRIWSEIACL